MVKSSGKGPRYLVRMTGAARAFALEINVRYGFWAGLRRFRAGNSRNQARIPLANLPCKQMLASSRTMKDWLRGDPSASGATRRSLGFSGGCTDGRCYSHCVANLLSFGLRLLAEMVLHQEQTSIYLTTTIVSKSPLRRPIYGSGNDENDTWPASSAGRVQLASLF